MLTDTPYLMGKTRKGPFLKAYPSIGSTVLIDLENFTNNYLFATKDCWKFGLPAKLLGDHLPTMLENLICTQSTPQGDKISIYKWLFIRAKHRQKEYGIGTHKTN